MLEEDYQRNTASTYFPSDETEKYFIKGIWRVQEFNVSEKTETILPKGTVEIIFNFSDEIIYHNSSFNIRKKLPCCFINGINYKPFDLIKKGRHVFLGIQLNTIGLKALFNVPVKEFNNTVLESGEISKSLDALYDQLYSKKSFDQQVQEIRKWIYHTISISKNNTAIKQVYGLFFSGGFNDISVGKLKNEVYLSDRQLRRLSNEWLGMNTEKFIRYSKYLSSLHLLHQPGYSLTQIGFAVGYYDQSHFIREFKSFTGLTPKKYQLSTTHLPGHIDR